MKNYMPRRVGVWMKAGGKQPTCGLADMPEQYRACQPRTMGDDRKMNNEPHEREPIDRMRARLEALLKANAAPRCGARSKRTGKPCRGAAMPNGRCKLH